MSVRDQSSTKHKILDAAEEVYAEEGSEGLTLRAITERAGVNLASINYHFGIKEALCQAMLARVLDPLYAERGALLDTLEEVNGEHIRPTHVIAAIILPLAREFTRKDQTANRIAFFLRISSDPSTPIRAFLCDQYRGICRRFDETFIRSVPTVPRDEALWRSRVFFNALPGTIGNQNMVSMLSELLLRPGMTIKDLIIHFGAVVEAVTTDSADVEALANDVLAQAVQTSTLRALQAHLPTRPENMLEHTTRFLWEPALASALRVG
ncbi:TetR/AcrR family transcriptional regulator [Robbsia andropogonis]|uniref:TetR/AcrR family transcriptional regulator n=1 Tax=Robbsia andropogonis TaxID=28092 RepID=UPI002A6AD431|nr:TetR family transcriptional regulator [Robbsia andropogonis]